jgi:hypothetical protein
VGRLWIRNEGKSDKAKGKRQKDGKLRQHLFLPFALCLLPFSLEFLNGSKITTTLHKIGGSGS